MRIKNEHHQFVLGERTSVTDMDFPSPSSPLSSVSISTKETITDTTTDEMVTSTR